MKIKIAELRQLAEVALKKQGYDEPETKQLADIIMFAQLRGNSQGVVKLIGGGMPKRQGGSTPKIVKETPVSALLDGNKTHAMLVVNQITELAIEKAKKSGVGIVGHFNTDESSGALGYYVKKIADQGLIGIAYSSAPAQMVAPYQSNEARFCTNPMAYGIPTEDEPIILDMATSAIAFHGLRVAKTAGQKLPPGIGYDKDGNETQDPAEIMAGAIKTFGGHKGSGLALIVQIFAGALVQADSFDDKSDNAGDLVMAIDPDILTTKALFKKEVSSVIRRLKTARKIDNSQEILVPGERANIFYLKVEAEGEIEVEDNLLAELRKSSV